MRQKISQESNKLRNPAKAKILQRFFKTGKGEYSEGDIFLGIAVPEQRKVVKKYFSAKGGPASGWKDDVQKLLNSKIHEYRLVGVLILVEKYKKISHEFSRNPSAPLRSAQDDTFLFYLKNTKNINNWDLVDLSAPNIVGNYLLDSDPANNGASRKILYKLAKSKNLWERRIAIISTLTFIREKQFADAIKISEILLSDSHDLIHKAVGWMLREIGKQDPPAGKKELIKFLDKYTLQMPRTMLRYAIEKLPEKKRKYYLNLK
ncbi:DNA alkylation repair protein [Candidatus Parcubacteria bacterium]|nr:DNA alkylation repair protein [Candidatus Parcubacteria bacterium]